MENLNSFKIVTHKKQATKIKIKMNYVLSTVFFLIVLDQVTIIKKKKIK